MCLVVTVRHPAVKGTNSMGATDAVVYRKKEKNIETTKEQD